ncbi:hypothetical protein [Plantactinospora sp. BB1]|uniref:hypothetical protein n=1 Tax=Plantactinospora sp. BB1 TaxID=2071627 RepID=UPI000D177E53|nr:hypothetical protein [Plantactinospora sp. BB1]AVT38012.1 hypothetical protein C6W10_17955 [Plantactinospora sp. BB1]
MPTTNPPTRAADRLEGVVLVLILLTVGGAAGAASFTHVHDWTMDNSPAHTPGWFGWANAVISELVPIAALLTIRRRRRIGAPIGYPVVLLIAAASLSLAAQLAVAKPSPSGWLLAAVPALAFMALVKLVLNPVKTQAGTTDTPAAADPIRVQVTEPVTVESEPPAISPAPEPVDIPTHMIPTARFAVVQHEQTTGQPITVNELSHRLDVDPAVARELLTVIRDGQ